VNLGQITGSAAVIRGMRTSDTLRTAAWPTGAKTEEKAPPSGDHGARPEGGGKRERKAPPRNQTLSAQSSSLAIRSSSGSKLKFQTGWGRNLTLETRFDQGEGAISPCI
jgi:hypothetical protein